MIKEFTKQPYKVLLMAMKIKNGKSFLVVGLEHVQLSDQKTNGLAMVMSK
jgi:hypothetical protein